MVGEHDVEFAAVGVDDELLLLPLNASSFRVAISVMDFLEWMLKGNAKADEASAKRRVRTRISNAGKNWPG